MQKLHFAGVQNFALEQGLRDADQNLAMGGQNVFGPLIARGDKGFSLPGQF